MHSIMEIPGISLSVKPKPIKPAPIARVPVEAVNRPVADGIANSTSYALAALLTELGITERAQPGARFDQVYKSGCALGELIGGGMLPEAATFNALVEAGCKSKLDRYECIKSAKNGIAKGKLNPRGKA
jgi:hypothetical protein